MRCRLLVVGLGVILPASAQAFLGSEMMPLMQLVAGQVTEIERMTESLGVTREQTSTLRELNLGVNQTIEQINHLQSIIERSQGVDPEGVQNLAALNDLMTRAKANQEEIEAMMTEKTELADQVIAGSALQGDTAYKMGQEMVISGSTLAEESKTASPGRSSQIVAASSSAQMVAKGVELQTMAQMVQLQAMTLEFQKNQVRQEIKSSRVHRTVYMNQLSAVRSKRGKI